MLEIAIEKFADAAKSNTTEDITKNHSQNLFREYFLQLENYPAENPAIKIQCLTGSEITACASVVKIIFSSEYDNLEHIARLEFSFQPSSNKIFEIVAELNSESVSNPKTFCGENFKSSSVGRRP